LCRARPIGHREHAARTPRGRSRGRRAALLRIARLARSGIQPGIHPALESRPGHQRTLRAANLRRRRPDSSRRTANGGYTDYLKLGRPKPDKMTTAEIGTFLVVCTLASKLYFLTYRGSTSLKEPSCRKKLPATRRNANGCSTRSRENMRSNQRSQGPI